MVPVRKGPPGWPKHLRLIMFRIMFRIQLSLIEQFNIGSGDEN